MLIGVVIGVVRAKSEPPQGKEGNACGGSNADTI